MSPASDYINEPKFVGRDDAVPWTRYDHISKNYRSSKVYGTNARCLASLFEWHTETLNAWTMIVGALVALCCVIYALSQQNLQPLDRLISILFFLSVTLHTPLSVGYHLLMPISPGIDLYWRRLDTGGVLFVSVLLSFTLSYYVFPLSVVLALTSASLLFFLFGLLELRTWKPGEPAPRGYLSMLISSGVSVYLLPMAWQSVVDISNSRLTVPLLSFGAFLSLGTGVTVFALAIPQRWYPDKLSTIGTAHHYMHLTLIIANLCEFFFILHMSGRS
jgi:predicted membrane channel-forming protein YqfA (hemolysin III family)